MWRSLVALIPLPLLVVAIEKTHGISPDILSRYTPTEEGKWTCLDGSKDIPWYAVNDDFCDCPDESDEPGTSACPRGTFYCHNVGHTGASISSARVGDGLCEPECCDGSDEAPGVCPNTCDEVGKAHREIRDAELKIQKTGAKIRASYIAFAQKEKVRLETSISNYESEISLREREVERLKDVADRTESLSAAALEHKKQSPLYQSLLTHSRTLKALHELHQKTLEREQALQNILEALRTGYNPNYQDMAVLEAVRGWEHFKGEQTEQGEGEKHESDQKDGNQGVEQVPDSEEEVLSDLDLSERVPSLLETDYVSLLLEHDSHLSSSGSDFTLFDLSMYLPDSMIPQYERLKEEVLGVLKLFGISSKHDNPSSDSAGARKAYEDAQRKLDVVRTEKRKADEEAGKLFAVGGFGVEGEWKKLDGTCLERDTGEYTYELCFFGEALQRPTRGGSSNRLGRFSGWHPSSEVSEGTQEYYSRQVYSNGDKCWNGPHRSVVFVMRCGVENAIETVEELEKCEYQFTGTSPALCLPLERTETVPVTDKPDAGRDEL